MYAACWHRSDVSSALGLWLDAIVDRDEQSLTSSDTLLFLLPQLTTLTGANYDG